MTIKYEDALRLVEAELPKLKPVLRYINWHLGGSTYINGEGNDVDVIILLPKGHLTFGMLDDAEWRHLGKESYDSWGMFDSYRKGELNLILTDDPVYYHSWEIARAVCRGLSRYGLNTRDARVFVHSVVCDGVGV